MTACSWIHVGYMSRGERAAIIEATDEIPHIFRERSGTKATGRYRIMMTDENAVLFRLRYCDDFAFLRPE